MSKPPPKFPTTPDPIPVVMIEPASGAWWESNGAWGNRFQGDFPGQPGDIVPVQNMIQFPGPPREIGISLFRNDSPAQAGAPVGATGPQNAEVYAQVIYGAGGVANTLLLDWANGTNFSLPCSALRVNAMSYQPRVTSFGPPIAPPYNNRMGVLGNPPVAQLTLMTVVGINGAARSQPPSFTTLRFDINAGSASNVNVPEFAVRAIPLISYTGGGIVPIVPSDFFIASSDSFGNLYQSQTLTEQILLEGLPLPGRGSTRVTIVNNGVLNIHVAVKFLLSL